MRHTIMKDIHCGTGDSGGGHSPPWGPNGGHQNHEATVFLWRSEGERLSELADNGLHQHHVLQHDVVAVHPT